MVLYNRFKAERIACGKTQEEIATALGITTRAYQYKESGKSDFTTSEFEKFLEIVNIPKTNMHIFFD